jgi:hypothetical protein
LEPAQQAIGIDLRLVLSNRVLERLEPAQQAIGIDLLLVLSNRVLERLEPAQQAIGIGLRLVLSNRVLERLEPAQQAIGIDLLLVLSNRVLERSKPAQHGISIGILKSPQTPWDESIRPTNWHSEGNGHDERDRSQDRSDGQVRAWLAERLGMQQTYYTTYNCHYEYHIKGPKLYSRSIATLPAVVPPIAGHTERRFSFLTYV